MYTAAPGIQVGAYPDLWRKGRYRVELTAELPCDSEDVDAVLQNLGYHITDADQWGRTYRHSQDPNRSAEIDELEDSGEYIRLLLRAGDLDGSDVEGAEDQLASLYGGLHQMCRGSRDDDGYDPLCHSVDLEADEYAIPVKEYCRMEIDS